MCPTDSACTGQKRKLYSVEKGQPPAAREYDVCEIYFRNLPYPWEKNDGRAKKVLPVIMVGCALSCNQCAKKSNFFLKSLQ